MSCTAAFLTRLLNDLAFTMTFIAGTRCLHNSKWCALVHTYLSAATAVGASGCTGSFFRTGTGTLFTIFYMLKRNCLFTAFCSFFKRNINAGFRISASSWCIWICLSTTKSSKATKYTVKDITKIKITLERAAPCCTAAKIRVNPCMTKLVITGTFFFV